MAGPRPRALALLLIPLGLFGYLMVNKEVTGDAFTFLRYQREHWSQSMGFFFNTASYQMNYYLEKLATDRSAAFGLWLPNLLFLLGAPLAMLFVRKRPAAPAETDAQDGQSYALRPSYLAYFLAYYAIGMGATWLLSAPRYLTACFPLPIAMAVLTGRRAPWIAYTLLFAAQLLFLWAYVAGGPVY